VPQVDVEDWARRLAAKWPQVESVWLCGSRAHGWHDPLFSDYDVIVCLRDDCYERSRPEGCVRDLFRPKDQIEQRIAFDPEFNFGEALDLFFLDPGGALSRWAWGPGDPPEWVLREEEWLRQYLLAGDVIGDFDRLYRDLKNAKCLFSTNPDGR
jgi:hypothetical protein